MEFCRKHKKRRAKRKGSALRGLLPFGAIALLVVAIFWQVGLAGLVSDSGLFFDHKGDDFSWDGDSPLTWSAINASDQLLGDPQVWFLPGLTLVAGPAGDGGPLADSLSLPLVVAGTGSGLLADGIIAIILEDGSGGGAGYFLRQAGYGGVYSLWLADAEFAEMAADDIAGVVAVDGDLSPLLLPEGELDGSGSLVDEDLLAAIDDVDPGGEPAGDDPVGDAGEGELGSLVADLVSLSLVAYDDDWSYPAGFRGSGAGGGNGGAGGGGAGGNGGAGGGGDQTPVPEPATVVLFATGLAGLVRRYRR